MRLVHRALDVLIWLLACLAVILLLVILVGVWSGCTIAPAPVHATTAAFDGNEQNGGFLGFLPSGAGHITAHAQARYEALLSKGYAKGLILPLPGPLDGLAALPDGTWSIDLEHLTLFGQMQHAFDGGVTP